MSAKRVTSSTGIGEANLYSAVRLTIQDRSCTMNVMEVPDGVPVLIGQLPLEHLDFVIDMRQHALIGNPAHGGEHVYELLWWHSVSHTNPTHVFDRVAEAIQLPFLLTLDLAGLKI